MRICQWTLLGLERADGIFIDANFFKREKKIK